MTALETWLRTWLRAQAECAEWMADSAFDGLDGQKHMRPFPWRAWLTWGACMLPVVAVIGALWAWCSP